MVIRIRDVFQRGVTLTELLAVVAILGIIAAIAVPYYGDYIERQRLVGASEAMYSQLQQAKRSAISNNRTVSLFVGGLGSDNWCATVSEGASVNADCSGGYIVSSLANPSVIITNNSDFPGIVLLASNASVSFVMPGVITSGAQSFVLRSSRLGDVFIDVENSMRLKACSDDINKYPSC